MVDHKYDVLKIISKSNENGDNEYSFKIQFCCVAHISDPSDLIQMFALTLKGWSHTIIFTKNCLDFQYKNNHILIT